MIRLSTCHPEETSDTSEATADTSEATEDALRNTRLPSPSMTRLSICDPLRNIEGKLTEMRQYIQHIEECTGILTTFNKLFAKYLVLK